MAGLVDGVWFWTRGARMAKQVVLSERLDSAAAGALRIDLATAEGSDVTLDASGVSVLGGLCLELLLCARHLWHASGHCFSITAPSAAFSDNLARFGLSPDDFAPGDTP